MDERTIKTLTISVEIDGETASVEIAGLEKMPGATADMVIGSMAAMFNRDGYEVRKMTPATKAE